MATKTISLWLEAYERLVATAMNRSVKSCCGHVAGGNRRRARRSWLGPFFSEDEPAQVERLKQEDRQHRGA